MIVIGVGLCVECVRASTISTGRGVDTLFVCWARHQPCARADGQQGTARYEQQKERADNPPDCVRRAFWFNNHFFLFLH